MTLNEMAYALAEMQEKSDDYAFVERMKFTVINHRALLIRRDVDRNATISNQYQQSFVVEGFTFHDLSDSERSSAAIPIPLRLKNSTGITRVQGEDSGTLYYPCTLESLAYMEYSKFTSSSLNYFMSDGYLHLYPCEDDRVRVTGIFQDPREIPGYQGDNSEFPIPSDMAQQVLQSILSGEFQIQDPNNNQVDIESQK